MKDKTRFSELRRGDRFTLPIDADGYEPVWYFIDRRAGILYGGNCRGHYRTTAAAEELTAETPIVLLSGRVRLNNRVTEVERVALTLLDKHSCIHPALTVWKIALCENPDEMRDLDGFAYEEGDKPAFDDGKTLRQVCQAQGFAFHARRYDHDARLFALIWDEEPAGEYTYDQQESEAYRADGGRYDCAALALADKVATYRQMGRPDGDYTTTIMGIGAPLLNVTTSLAAAIAEYHTRIRNCDLSSRHNK